MSSPQIRLTLTLVLVVAGMATAQLPITPPGSPVPEPAEQWVNESGDAMTGDLHMGPNAVLLAGGALRGTDGTGLEFNRTGVCLRGGPCDTGGDITSVTAGPGLLGGGVAGDVTLSVDTAAVTMANQACDVGDVVTGIDATGSLTCEAAGVPTGMVSFFAGTQCPAGWASFDEAAGRYMVGTTNSSTAGATVGTALEDQEDRPVGQHTHVVTDPGHRHALSLWKNYGVAGNGPHAADTKGYVHRGSASTSQSLTGISIDASGDIAGTNAPYIQLLACQKT